MSVERAQDRSGTCPAPAWFRSLGQRKARPQEGSTPLQVSRLTGAGPPPGLHLGSFRSSSLKVTLSHQDVFGSGTVGWISVPWDTPLPGSNEPLPPSRY